MATNYFSYSPATKAAFGTKPDPLKLPDPLANLKAVTPGYGAINDLLSQTILNNLQGILSPDVSRAVLDNANARAVGGGFGGSQFGRNLGLRDLGLTSLDLQNRGFGQALNYIPMQKNTATLDPGLQNDINQFNTLLKAAPSPVASAQWWLDQSNESTKVASQAQAKAAAEAAWLARTSDIPSGTSYSGGGGAVGAGGMSMIPNYGTAKPFGGYTPPGSTWQYGTNQVQLSAPQTQTQNLAQVPQTSVPQSAATSALASSGINPTNYGYNPASPFGYYQGIPLSI